MIPKTLVRNPMLILASGSPQRQRLLDEAGYRFRIVIPSVQAECGVCSKETPGELVARLAYQKAADVAERLRPSESPDGVVVGCDTVAECAGQILGKPNDREHARQMFTLVSGHEHRVYSGLCLWPLASGRPQVQVARTTLRMDSLGEREIDEYLASGLWEGKAGAFGYQERVGWLRIVDGSESNVVGLPLELLAEMLAKLGA
ncbi:MAG: septum formation protein Maf [Planctomycetia bacterium]|nr:septum formation protein Maf [Planctomycetia bacterium]